MPSPDGARIAARLEALWQIARGPAGGADRPAWSAAEARGVRLVAGWAREAGLEPALDPYGNLWAAPAGVDGPLVSSGSHVDTVPDGGRFDGALGVVLALEAAEALPGKVALLSCAAEEAPRFGAGTLGSRLATGVLADEALDGIVDAGRRDRTPGARRVPRRAAATCRGSRRCRSTGSRRTSRCTSSSAASCTPAGRSSASSSASPCRTGTRSWSRAGPVTRARWRWRRVPTRSPRRRSSCSSSKARRTARSRRRWRPSAPFASSRARSASSRAGRSSASRCAASTRRRSPPSEERVRCGVRRGRRAARRHACRGACCAAASPAVLDPALVEAALAAAERQGVAGGPHLLGGGPRRAASRRPGPGRAPLRPARRRREPHARGARRRGGRRARGRGARRPVAGLGALVAERRCFARDS